MDVNSHHRCPDCGAAVWLPLTLQPISGRGSEIRVQIREIEFQDAFERHVMLNPEKHPTLAIAVE
jgi:hypothetical protein